MLVTLFQVAITITFATAARFIIPLTEVIIHMIMRITDRTFTGRSHYLQGAFLTSMELVLVSFGARFQMICGLFVLIVVVMPFVSIHRPYDNFVKDNKKMKGVRSFY